MNKYVPAKPKTTLWWIGVWATVWWAVSCLYFLLLFWLARNTYVEINNKNSSASLLSDWGDALTEQYQGHKYLQVMAISIIAVWVIGAYLWLTELKQQKISVKAALKDLFLTVRK